MEGDISQTKKRKLDHDSNESTSPVVPSQRLLITGESCRILYSLFNQRWMKVLGVIGESFIVPIVIKKIDDSSDRKYRITITYMDSEDYEIYRNNNRSSKYYSLLDMKFDESSDEEVEEDEKEEPIEIKSQLDNLKPTVIETDFENEIPDIIRGLACLSIIGSEYDDNGEHEQNSWVIRKSITIEGPFDMSSGLSVLIQPAVVYPRCYSDSTWLDASMRWFNPTTVLCFLPNIQENSKDKYDQAVRRSIIRTLGCSDIKKVVVLERWFRGKQDRSAIEELIKTKEFELVCNKQNPSRKDDEQFVQRIKEVCFQ